MTVFLRLVLIVLLSCNLAGCGQKGPLQRPGQTATAVALR
ncbi:MAG: lipoprotein [Pseudomonadales bacterium]|nr:lipoprotein [Pseudomonadales bacterium]MCP5329371.1 lipoprotein [Pseudomonadales bacterium]MCP5344661.1 lipoprotein [Pseudomonadales bacterium]